MPTRTRSASLRQVSLFAIGGLLVVSAFATLQFRLVLGITPSLLNYVVPSLVGALAGAALGVIYIRLRQREAELNRFFDLSIDLLCIADADGHFHRLNPAFEQTLGWSSEMLLAKRLVDFVHPDDVDATLAAVAKLGCGTAAVQFENRYRRQDGTYKWLDWTAHPTSDGLIYAVAHDVTARKTIEGSLRESNERLLAVVDTAVDGIITIDEQGTIETANPATERIFGYSQSEMVGQNVKMLMPAPYQAEHDGYLGNYRRTGKRKIIGIGREVAGLRKDGTTFPLELAVAESVLDNRRMFTGIVRDITQRKEREKSLRESEAHNRALVEAIPDSILRVHRDGTYLYVKAPLDYTPVIPTETMIGKNVRNIVSSALAQQYIDHITRALMTQTLQIFEYAIQIGEELRSREARVMPSKADEVTILIRDITEQRQTELAMVAAVTAERDRIGRDLHDSVTQTLFAASMIADVLPTLWEMNVDMAKARLGELRELTRGAMAEMRTLLLELRPSALVEAELDQLLQQLMDATVGRARVQGQLTIDGDINDLAIDTHVAIYRTVQEALSNVAKHAEASQVAVTLHRQDGQLDISICDDGCGFDPVAIKGGHFGLGNMRERIAAIGGTLSMKSEPDQGTTVSIKLQNIACRT